MQSVDLLPFKRHTNVHWPTAQFVEEIVAHFADRGLRRFLDFGTEIKPPWKLPKNGKVPITRLMQLLSWNAFPFHEREALKRLELLQVENYALLEPYIEKGCEFIRYLGTPLDGSSWKDLPYLWLRKRAQDPDWVSRQLRPYERHFRFAFDFMAVRNDEAGSTCRRILEEYPDSYIEANPKLERWQGVPCVIRDDTAYKREKNDRFRQVRPGDIVIIIDERSRAYESAHHWVRNYGAHVAVPYNWMKNNPALFASLMNLTGGGVARKAA